MLLSNRWRRCVASRGRRRSVGSISVALLRRVLICGGLRSLVLLLLLVLLLMLSIRVRLVGVRIRSFVILIPTLRVVASLLVAGR